MYLTEPCECYCLLVGLDGALLVGALYCEQFAQELVFADVEDVLGEEEQEGDVHYVAGCFGSAGGLVEERAAEV